MRAVRRATITACVASLCAMGAAACGGDDSGSAGTEPAATATGAPPVATSGAAVIDPGDGGDYAPVIDPANFVATVDNPYMPLTPGSKWVYEGESDGEPERIEVVVTDEQRVVMGVTVVVVRDTVYVDDEIEEDTYDWFAQDTDGNVWYFGEDVTNFDNGQPSDSGGSWEAGVDGALPGIVMPAAPTVGDSYRQEFYPGEAEDLGEILAIDGTLTVPAGSFEQVVIARDWNPLEPDVVEEKQYAPGVGLIAERAVEGADDHAELTEFTPG